MNTLFYIALYNGRRNEYARWLVTQPASHGEQRARDYAQAEALAACGPDWTVRSITTVCATPDHLFQEL